MVRLASCTHWYWYIRGHFSEGASWITRAFALPGADMVAPLDRARALLGAGHLTHFLGDQRHAVTLVQQALVEWERLQDKWGLGVAHLLLGTIAEDAGHYADAVGSIEEALKHFRAGNDQVNEALALYHLGVVMLGLEDLDQAIQLTETALEMQRANEDMWGEGNSLCHLGLYSGMRRQHEQAVSLLQECLRLRLEMGNPPEIALCLACIAMTAVQTDHPRLAALLYAVEVRVRKTVGSPRNLPERLIFEESAEQCRNMLGTEMFEQAWIEGQTMPLDDAITLALAFQPTSTKAVTPERDGPGRHSDLTDREFEVLELVARGLTNPEIAEKLFISPGTVRIHVSNILGKVGAKTRTEAVNLARRRGLLLSS